jgi:uncharacterized Zn finger protein
MQDLSTGQIHALEEEQFKLDQQRAKDAAIPQRENQGPVFSVGEVLEIRGGKFRVHAITSSRLYLDSLPSA